MRRSAANRDHLIQFLINQKVIRGEVKPAPPAKCLATPIEGQTYIRSPQSGVVVYQSNCGDRVRKGDIVAVMVDPVEATEIARTEITAPISGTVFSRTMERMVGPGQIILGIAGKEIIAERVGTHLLSD